MLETRKLSPAGEAMVAAHRARVALNAAVERRSLTTDDVRELMGAEDLLGLSGMSWNQEGGFIEAHEVRVTEPWRPSLVRLGERPRVALSTITRRCDHCGEQYQARRQSSRFCGGACRLAAHRGAGVHV